MMAARGGACGAGQAVRVVPCMLILELLSVIQEFGGLYYSARAGVDGAQLLLNRG